MVEMVMSPVFSTYPQESGYMLSQLPEVHTHIYILRRFFYSSSNIGLFRRNFSISPDEDYVAIGEKNEIQLWDIKALRAHQFSFNYLSETAIPLQIKIFMNLRMKAYISLTNFNTEKIVQQRKMMLSNWEQFIEKEGLKEAQKEVIGLKN